MALATCHRLERHALATCSLQAIAIAAERLQLVLAPSICSQLHQGAAATSPQLAAAARASQGVAPWHSVPQQRWACTPWSAAAAAASSKAAGAAQMRWHSTGPQHLEGTESGQQPASSGGKSGLFEVRGVLLLVGLSGPLLTRPAHPATTPVAPSTYLLPEPSLYCTRREAEMQD